MKNYVKRKIYFKPVFMYDREFIRSLLYISYRHLPIDLRIQYKSYLYSRCDMYIFNKQPIIHWIHRVDKTYSGWINCFDSI